MGLRRWEQPPASSSVLWLCFDLEGLLSTIFKLRNWGKVRKSFFCWSLCYTQRQNMKQQEYTVRFSAVTVLGLQPHKYSPTWCLSALQIIYSQKNFRTAKSRFLYLVSVFIPMISFTVWPSLWVYDTVLVWWGKSSVFLYESMETEWVINRNVNSRRIHHFSGQKFQKFPLDSRKRGCTVCELSCGLDVMYIHMWMASVSRMCTHFSVDPDLTPSRLERWHTLNLSALQPGPRGEPLVLRAVSTTAGILHCERLARLSEWQLHLAGQQNILPRAQQLSREGYLLWFEHAIMETCEHTSAQTSP